MAVLRRQLQIVVIIIIIIIINQYPFIVWCDTIAILCNHYFIILKLLLAIKGFILYQIKQTALKSGYNFTSYGKFTDTRWNEEL